MPPGDSRWVPCGGGSRLRSLRDGAPDLVGQAEEGTQPTALREGTSERFLATQTLAAPESRLVVELDGASP